MMEDLQPFGLGDFVSLISNIEVSNWGNKLTIYCLYNPDELIPYSLIFENCSKITWSVHSPENVHDIEADIYDISLRNKPEQKLAIIFTDIFEISVLYEALIVNKD